MEVLDDHGCEWEKEENEEVEDKDEEGVVLPAGVERLLLLTMPSRYGAVAARKRLNKAVASLGAPGACCAPPALVVVAVAAAPPPPPAPAAAMRRCCW